MPGQSTDIFEEYTLTVTLDNGTPVAVQDAPNGDIVLFNDNNPTTVYPVLKPQPFRALTEAVLVEIDNPTPLLIVLPQENIRVMPWVTGVRAIIPQRSTTAAISVAPLSTYPGIVPTMTFSALIRYWQQPRDMTPNSGSGSSTFGLQGINSIYGVPVNTVDDVSVNQGVTANALFTAGGYDKVTQDSPNYSPKRTPNVWDKGLVALSTTGDNVVYTYTSPANQYWRLIDIDLTADASGGTFPAPTNRILYKLLEGTNIIQDYCAIPRDSGNYAATKHRRYAGNGIKALATGSKLSVIIYVDSGNVVLSGRVNVGMYVGP